MWLGSAKSAEVLKVAMTRLRSLGQKDTQQICLFIQPSGYHKLGKMAKKGQGKKETTKKSRSTFKRIIHVIFFIIYNPNSNIS